MNWWEKSKKKERKPYKVYRIAHGEEKFIADINAFSSEQARAFAIQTFRWLKDSLAMGYEIVARLDQEELNRRNAVKEKEEREYEEKERRIQDIYD